MPLEKQKQNLTLIPLCRFARSGQYSQAYLSLLVQRKKLKAKRIGRNFYTTKEWFDEYLIQHSRKQFTVEDGGIKNQSKLLAKNLTKAKKKVSSRLLGFSFFVGQKVGRAKAETVKKVGLKPWVGRLIIFSWFLLILSIYLVKYSPTTADKIINLSARVYLAPGEKIISLVEKYKPEKIIGSYRLDTEPARAER
jgi:hypothetical protein